MCSGSGGTDGGVEGIELNPLVDGGGPGSRVYLGTYVRFREPDKGLSIDASESFR